MLFLLNVARRLHLPLIKKDADSSAEKSSSSRHSEHHATHGLFIRDSIIGFADGLTVPFALTAGLSVFNDSRIVVIGGLAELFAGAISMGLGAFLAAETERKHYEVEERRERREVRETPRAEEEEVYEILGKYGVAREACEGVVCGLKANEDMWVQFMMDFELKLEKPRRRMAWIEGLVMGVSYFLGETFHDLDVDANGSRLARWSAAHDPVLRLSSGQPRLVHLDWHFRGRSDRLWICQGSGYRHDSPRRSMECCSDAVRGGLGGWCGLRHHERHQLDWQGPIGREAY